MKIDKDGTVNALKCCMHGWKDYPDVIEQVMSQLPDIGNEKLVLLHDHGNGTHRVIHDNWPDIQWNEYQKFDVRAADLVIVTYAPIKKFSIPYWYANTSFTSHKALELDMVYKNQIRMLGLVRFSPLYHTGNGEANDAK